MDVRNYKESHFEKISDLIIKLELLTEFFDDFIDYRETFRFEYDIVRNCKRIIKID